MPAFSIIIPWYNQPVISQTLEANKAILEKYDFEIIVVNTGGDTASIQNLVAGNATICELPSLKFNRSLGLNIGALLARSGYLLFVDASVLLNDNFISNAIALVEMGEVATVEKMISSAPVAPQSSGGMRLEELIIYAEVATGDGRRAELPLYRNSLTNHSKIDNRQIFVRKQDFLKINGMNSAIGNTGFEDIDLLIRLQLVAGVKIRPAGPLTWLAHDTATEEAEEQKLLNNLNEKSFLAVLEFYQDRESFAGSYDKDVSRWEAELELTNTTSIII